MCERTEEIDVPIIYSFNGRNALCSVSVPNLKTLLVVPFVNYYSSSSSSSSSSSASRIVPCRVLHLPLNSTFHLVLGSPVLLHPSVL
jgi:hypothetical protein